MLISINNVLKNFIRLGKVSCDINIEFCDFLEWICQYSKNQKHGVIIRLLAFMELSI